MSSLSNKVDVLVCGAGPTGLLTALALARSGLEVEVVDRAWRSAAQSYACGLHGASLPLLGKVGVEGAVLEAGLRVETLGFYEGGERRAELRFAELKPPCDFLLVVPQDRLEELLEEELRTRGVRVRWGHRLDDVQSAETHATATVEKLALTSVGYPFARSEEMVDSVTEVHARFVVGTDGANSHVRAMLGIETERLGPAAAYQVIEFEPAGDAGQEVRIALGPETADVFWPQPGMTCRWSLQLPGQEEERPEKARHSFVVLNEEVAPDERHELEERLRSRAPWFQTGIKEVDWTTVVGFDQALARRLGSGRCWLAGDAAHQASPVGMQSMNVALREALDLADRLRRILREGAPMELLDAYERERRAEWQFLLGGARSVKAGPRATPWTRAHRGRLLACLPGSGPELTALLAQLGLEPA